MCNSKFYQITNSVTSEILKVESKDKLTDDLYAEYIQTIICLRCGSDEHEESLLLCDGCDQGFHTHCLGILKVPELDEWFCHDCILEQSTEIRKKQ